MNLPWFHVEQAPEPGQSIGLDQREVRHLGGARRIGNGDEVVIFDGAGVTARARIEQLDRKAASCLAVVVSRCIHQRATPEVHLISALPKGERTATMLSMATQLGISSFRTLRCERGVVTQGTGAVVRWKRIMVEACKQSRRPWLPEVGEPIDLAGVVTLAGRDQWAVRLANPGGLRTDGLSTADHVKCLAVVVGPEGGFTRDEVSICAEAGAELVDLGEGVLRIETAAVAMVTLAGIARHTVHCD